MIPTSVLEARYDRPTVDRAASLIDALRTGRHVSASESLSLWATVLGWFCENDGGVDKSMLTPSQKPAAEQRTTNTSALKDALSDAWDLIPNDLIGPWGVKHANVLRSLAIERLAATATVRTCETCRFTQAICGYSAPIPMCGYVPKTTASEENGS
jgi:hypothetical protein